MANLKIKNPNGSWDILATQEYVDNNKPNWNAKEGEKGYIENRTHYSNGAISRVVLEETDIWFHGGVSDETYTIPSLLEADKTYTIHFGDAIYECPVMQVDYSMIYPGAIAKIFGNIAFAAGMLQIENTDANVPTAPFLGALFIMPEEEVAVLSFQLVNATDSEETITISIIDNNEDVVKIPSKYIPTPNWNAQRGEDGYIKNRTHWVEKKTGVIVLEETSPIDIDGETGFATPWVNEIVAGNTYQVTHNGTVYNCTGIEPPSTMEMPFPGMVFLGNSDALGIPGGNSDAPFLIGAFPNMIGMALGMYGMYAAMEGSGLDDVISITGSSTVYHKLDSNFIEQPWWSPSHPISPALMGISAAEPLPLRGASPNFIDGLYIHTVSLQEEMVDSLIYTIKTESATIEGIYKYYPGDMDFPGRYMLSTLTLPKDTPAELSIVMLLLIQEKAAIVMIDPNSPQEATIYTNFPYQVISITNPRRFMSLIPPEFVAGVVTNLTDGDAPGSVVGAGGHSPSENSIAFGRAANVNGYNSFAIGDSSQTYSRNSLAMLGGRTWGIEAIALGSTEARGNNQFTIGKNNLADYNSNYLMIVGNGKTSSSNAMTLDWNGNARFDGDLYVQGTGTQNGMPDAKKVATEEYVNSKVAGIQSNYIALTDTVTGQLYHITIENGNLVSTLVEGGE